MNDAAATCSGTMLPLCGLNPFAVLGMLTAIACSTQQLAAEDQLRIRETPAIISVSDQVGPVLVYNKISPPLPEGVEPIYRRSGFIHPVASPNGKVLTAVFPEDHKHQDGLFSAWVKTRWQGRKVDFWNIAKGTGRVEHYAVKEIFSLSDRAGFHVQLRHRAVKNEMVDVLLEDWVVTVYPTKEDYRCFDIESTQTALTDSPLIVEKYHYGGMALRGLTRWVQTGDRDGVKSDTVPEASDFLNDLGSGRETGNHEKARWVSLYGTIDGESACITVLGHPGNFRFPQAARLHPSKPYFCFAPCVDDEFTIDRNHPLHNRFRYIVTDTKPDNEWLGKLWEQWSQE